MPSADHAQEKAIREPVRVVPHDLAWPASFAEEKQRLLSLFPGELRAVEHIGSTAIPGMPAKPIVDILAGVDSMAAADALFERVLRHGYTTSRAFNETLADRRWFMRSVNGSRTHHLHLVVFGSPTWHRHLRFRDCLRSNAALAQSYALLKAELAARFEHDREAYTDAKSAFVASVLSPGDEFMSDSSECLFCRIARGTIPAHLVYESPRLVAFLDIQPIRPGHALIVPREHFPYFDALPSEVAHEVLDLAQKLAPVLRLQWGVERVGFMFTGTDVAHAHAHVLPLVAPTDITSRRYIAEEHLTFRPAPRVPDSELAATAALLKAALAGSLGEGL